MPGARCTHSLVCKGRKHTSIRHRYTGCDPALPAQWFYGLLRALPGDRALLPPSPLEKLASQELDASVGASGPHDFAVREQRHSSRDVPRPSHPAPNVRDDRETPLWWDGMARDVPVIWVEWKAKCFCGGGLDEPNQVEFPEKTVVWKSRSVGGPGGRN